jgi:hypothetical protein
MSWLLRSASVAVVVGLLVLFASLDCRWIGCTSVPLIPKIVEALEEDCPVHSSISRPSEIFHDEKGQAPRGAPEEEERK